MKRILMTLSLAAMLAIPSITNAQEATPCKKGDKSAVCCQAKGNAQCKQECKGNCTPECKAKCEAQGKAECKAQCKAQGNALCKAAKDSCKAATPCKKVCRDARKEKGKKHVDIRKKGHRSDRHGKMMSRRDGQNVLFEGITLTAEQQQKMQSLREQQRADGRKAKADMKAQKSEDRQKRFAAYEKEVEKILTPEQYKQYEANKAAMKERRMKKANR